MRLSATRLNCISALQAVTIAFLITQGSDSITTQSGEFIKV